MNVLSWRLEDVVYIVRIHRVTKHGYKYVTCVEHEILKAAKAACERLSKYPDVVYTDFLTLTKNLCPVLKECTE